MPVTNGLHIDTHNP